MPAALKVVLAGGGTTGHIAPMIATAQALAREVTDIQLSCIGTARGLETSVVPAAGLELDLVEPVPMPRTPNLDLVKLPARLVKTVTTAAGVLRRRQADVVVGFGGYVSLPAYLAAKRLGIPVVVHEQNAVPGLANKVAARFARVVATSFPETPLRGAQFVGLPVREQISRLATQHIPTTVEARASLGLATERTTLLVSGGSQGARSINEATVAARDRLLAAGVQVLHVWGRKNFTDDLVDITDPATGATYRPVAYVDQMEQAYAAADVMLGRSGAGTVVETAIVGLPGLFVPLPHGNGEQSRNATALVAAGAARLIPDAELDAGRLLAEVTSVTSDPGRLSEMANAAQSLMPADAAEVLARLVIEAATRRRN